MSAAYNHSMGHGPLVIAQSFGTQGEADIAKGLLESAGVDAMIHADTAGGMRPHLAWAGSGFRVLVREEDVAAAREALKQASPTELVLIQVFDTQAEADAAQGALLSAGVPATVQDDSAGGWRSGVPWGGTGFRVLVPHEDTTKARDVLTQFLQN